MLPKSVPPNVHAEPLCDSNFPVTMATMDHLTGVRHRDRIDYKGESALEEALNSLIFDKEKIDTDQVALYLTYAMKQAIHSLYTYQNPYKSHRISGIAKQEEKMDHRIFVLF